MELSRLGNFGRGSYEEHLCEIILKGDQQLKRDVAYIFLSMFSSADHFYWRNETVWVILEKVLMCEVILQLGKQFRRFCIKICFYF